MIEKSIRISIHFNQEIIHFITNLHSYFALEVLETQYKKLKNELYKINNLDELISKHKQFINNIKNQCLLNEENTTINKKIFTIFNIILQFSTSFDIFNSILEEIKYENIDNKIGDDNLYINHNKNKNINLYFKKIKDLYNEYHYQMIELINIIELVGKSNLKYLSMKLDYNYYYSFIEKEKEDKQNLLAIKKVNDEKERKRILNDDEDYQDNYIDNDENINNNNINNNINDNIIDNKYNNNNIDNENNINVPNKNSEDDKLNNDEEEEEEELENEPNDLQNNNYQNKNLNNNIDYKYFKNNYKLQNKNKISQEKKNNNIINTNNINLSNKIHLNEKYKNTPFINRTKGNDIYNNNNLNNINKNTNYNISNDLKDYSNNNLKNIDNINNDLINNSQNSQKSYQYENINIPEKGLTFNYKNNGEIEENLVDIDDEDQIITSIRPKIYGVSSRTKGKYGNNNK